ncbi:MAG: CoA transferase subunit A [Candidatus Nanopelagicales bacterium]|jgi:3-oxoacid CoA-transferase subunit A
MSTKLASSALEALAGEVQDGMTIAVGGFGLSGIPTNLISALRDTGVKNLTIVSNNMGVDGKGLGLILENKQVTKVLSSYVGENKFFAEAFLDGSLDVEFVPQGTLAERLRAGGAGIPAFYTPTGVGTAVGEGKETRVFDGTTCLLERGIIADISLVRAWKADRDGNLIYRLTARNFNPLVAMASHMTIAEAETIVEGYLEPDAVMTPGVFVQKVVAVEDPIKHIEQRTTREGVA